MAGWLEMRQVLGRFCAVLQLLFLSCGAENEEKAEIR